MLRRVGSAAILRHGNNLTFFRGKTRKFRCATLAALDNMRYTSGFPAGTPGSFGGVPPTLPALDNMRLHLRLLIVCAYTCGSLV